MSHAHARQQYYQCARRPPPSGRAKSPVQQDQNQACFKQNVVLAAGRVTCKNSGNTRLSVLLCRAPNVHTPECAIHTVASERRAQSSHPVKRLKKNVSSSSSYQYHSNYLRSAGGTRSVDKIHEISGSDSRFQIQRRIPANLFNTCQINRPTRLFLIQPTSAPRSRLSQHKKC